uniref:Uncharacterized protein n=1 Tax=Oryza rufipogon TaxID=4529 RepID=A0A0E0QWD4_ORYRU
MVVVGVGVPRARSSRRDPFLLIGVVVPLVPAGSRHGAVAGVLLLLRRRIDGNPPAVIGAPSYAPGRLTSASAAALVDGVVGVVADRPSAKAVKVVLHVLCQLCLWSRNRVKAVDASAMSALVSLLLNKGAAATGAPASSSWWRRPHLRLRGGKPIAGGAPDGARSGGVRGDAAVRRRHQERRARSARRGKALGDAGGAAGDAGRRCGGEAALPGAENHEL